MSWLFGYGEDPKANAELTEANVSQANMNSAFSEGFRASDPRGRSAERQVEDLESNAESLPATGGGLTVGTVVRSEPRGRRPSHETSARSSSSLGSLSGKEDKVRRSAKPHWEAEDEEINFNTKSMDGEPSDDPSTFVPKRGVRHSLGLQPIAEDADGRLPLQWPWASPHRSHQEERDNDDRTITEFAETQSPDRAPLRSFEDFQESQTEAEKQKPKRAASSIEGSATLVSQPTMSTLEIQGARPVSHGTVASGLPLILVQDPNVRLQQNRYEHPSTGADQRSLQDDGGDDEDEEDLIDDEDEAKLGEQQRKKKFQLTQMIDAGADALRKEQEDIKKCERARELEEFATNRASNVIRQVAAMKKTYVDQRMKLFEDSAKMGREIKLREKKLMTWIALLSVLQKFDQKLKSAEIQDKMTDVYLKSLPEPPPPPPKEDAPDANDESLHEEYEMMRNKYQNRWETEGRKILGPEKFDGIRNMPKKGPAERQKVVIAEKCFQRAMDVMSEAQHQDLLRRAWRLENNWQPWSECEPLAYATQRLSKMDDQVADRMRNSQKQRRALQQSPDRSGGHRHGSAQI